MTLDQDTLKACNIVYELEPSKPPPTYVQKVKDTLLHFGSAGFEDIVDLNSDLEYESLEKKCGSRAQKRLLKKAGKATSEAQSLYKKGCAESGWQNLYSKFFDDTLHSFSNETSSDTRLSARSKLYYGSLESEFNCVWTLFGQQGHEHDKRRGLTMPKPDWMIAFPSYDDRYFDSLPKLRSGCQLLRHNGPMLSSFSSEVLLHLAKHGIQSQVSNSLANQRSGKQLDVRQYKCFPFLIMEHKGCKQGSATIEYCYWQTANGTAAALLLFQKLFKYKHPRGCDYTQVPPVIGISTVASEVKLWLTYTKPKYIKMDCIWTGDMKKLGHTLQLQCIFENIYLLATHELRPNLAVRIEHWLREYPLPSTKDASSQLPIHDETSQPSTMKDSRRFRTADASLQGHTTDDILQSGEDHQQEDFLDLQSLSSALYEVHSQSPSPPPESEASTACNNPGRTFYKEYDPAPFLFNENTFLNTKKELDLAMEDGSPDDSAWSKKKNKHSKSRRNSDDEEENDFDNNIIPIRELSKLKNLESFEVLVETSCAIMKHSEGYELYANWDDDEPALRTADLEQTDDELSSDELANGPLLFEAASNASFSYDSDDWLVNDDVGDGSDEWEGTDGGDSDGSHSSDESHSSAAVSDEDDDDDVEISHRRSHKSTPALSTPPKVTSRRRASFLSPGQQPTHQERQRTQSSTPASKLQPQTDTNRSTSIQPTPSTPPKVTSRRRTRLLSPEQQPAHQERQRARSSTPASKLQPQLDTSRSTSVPPALEHDEDARLLPQTSNPPSSLHSQTLKVAEIHRAIRMTFAGEKSEKTKEMSPQLSNQQSSRHEERPQTLGSFLLDEGANEVIDLSPQERNRQSSLHEISGVEEKLKTLSIFCPSLSSPSSSKVVEEPQDRPKTRKIFFPSLMDPSSSKSVEEFQDKLTTPRIFFPSLSGTSSPNLVEERQDKPKTPRIFIQFEGAMPSPESKLPQEGALLPSVERQPTMQFNFEFHLSSFER